MTKVYPFKKLQIATTSLALAATFIATTTPAQAISENTADSPSTTSISTENSAVKKTKEILSTAESSPVDVNQIQTGDNISASIPSTALGENEDEFISIQANDSIDSTKSINSDSQSLMTMMYPGETSTSFTIDIPSNFVAAVQPDGSVALVSADGKKIPFIKKPWAKDARGKSLKTYYTISGSQLVQQVDTKGAKYPIVADPSLQWKPSPYIALYGSQIDNLSNSMATIGLAAAGGSCAAASAKLGGWLGWTFRTVCAIVGVGGAKEAFDKIVQVWQSKPSKVANRCYGVKVAGYGSNIIDLPARDCSL